MEELLKALADVVAPPARLPEFRVYYDPESGTIIDYSMEDLPGDYIVVDKDTFHRYRFDLRVKDGKLVSVRPPIGKLVPNTDKGTLCVPGDVTLVDHDHPNAVQWSMHTYAQN